MVNIAETLVSNSTQLDNVDLMAGPRVFTITDVQMTASEQPLSIRLAEYDRPWKPGLTMRRLLSEMWGPESDEWIGRKVRLYRDETVKFGPTTPGGTRISHATHLDKTVRVTLPISKGKFAEFVVEPMKDETPASKPAPKPKEPTAQQVTDCTDIATLRDWWKATSEGSERREQIEQRVAELQAANDAPPGGSE